MRAEAEAAVTEARKSHERLREAIDILPQGIVFLDADGRYILWNKKYSEIYKLGPVQTGRAAAGHDPHRRGAWRLSRGDRA
jgi:PAS domain-containing protein